MTLIKQEELMFILFVLCIGEYCLQVPRYPKICNFGCLVPEITKNAQPYHTTRQTLFTYTIQYVYKLLYPSKYVHLYIRPKSHTCIWMNAVSRYTCTCFLLKPKVEAEQLDNGSFVLYQNYFSQFGYESTLYFHLFILSISVYMSMSNTRRLSRQLAKSQNKLESRNWVKMYLW